MGNIRIQELDASQPEERVQQMPMRSFLPAFYSAPRTIFTRPRNGGLDRHHYYYYFYARAR